MTGDELRVWRESAGMTQQSLADALGVPRNTVWRWESGRYPIAQPRLLQLALSGLEQEHAAAIEPPSTLTHAETLERWLQARYDAERRAPAAEPGGWLDLG